MKNKAKVFFNDYMDLANHSCTFWKKHWIGMTIAYVAYCGIMLGIGKAVDVYREKKWEKELEDYNKRMEELLEE